jgi:Tol biopolymer transport system component
MKKVIAFIGLVFVSSLSFGQIQSTEIWLIDLIQTEEKVTAKNEIRVTNNDHYDNQPCFSKDGSMIWYASMPDTAQSDLYSYNLKLKETKQVTNTPESEYQPFPIPFYKDKLSIIRVDADGAQRFYQIDMDGSEPATLIENEDSVAYYCWMNDTTLGMYMLNGVGGALHQYDLIPQQSI